MCEFVVTAVCCKTILTVKSILYIAAVERACEVCLRREGKHIKIDIAIGAV